MKYKFTYRRFALLCLINTSLCLVSAESAPSAGSSNNHDKYLKWHNVCLGGDTSKIDQQIAKFENQLTRSSGDNLARAYLGSAYALKAKHSFFPTTKLTSLRKGKEHMEAAVKGSPNNLRVRMVRAIAYHKVPRRFGTHPTSVSDFEFLLKSIKLNSNDLSANEQQAILYYAFLEFKESKHASAAEAKSLCHKINPNSKYGQLTK